MTNVPYNTNIPFASNSPSQDQPRMQENTNSLKSLIEIDHVGFGENQGGYHTLIHQTTQSTVNTIVGINQIFCGIPGTLVVDGVTTKNVPSTGEAQLYSLSGKNPTGTLSQLTGSTSAINGYQWLGQTILEWGTILTNGSGVAAVTFINTYQSVYSAVATSQGTGTVVCNASFINTAPVTQLSIFTKTNSGAAISATVSWMIIGIPQ